MVDLSWYAPGPGASAPPSCRGGRPAVPNPICVLWRFEPGDARLRRNGCGAGNTSNIDTRVMLLASKILIGMYDYP